MTDPTSAIFWVGTTVPMTVVRQFEPNSLTARLYKRWYDGPSPVIRTLSSFEKVKVHLVIERLADWNWGAFMNETDASCIAIGDTRHEAIENGQRELVRRGLR